MKSQQINFFLTNTDYAKMPEFLADLGFVVLDYQYAEPKAEDKDFLSTENSMEVFFVLKEQLSAVKFRNAQNGYVPDVLASPIISCFKGNLSENELHRGRLYFVKDTENGILKDKLFIQKSQSLFRKFKTFFCQTHLDGYKMFFVSENAAKMNDNGIVLVKI